MTQTIFNILSQINQEGIDNTQWTIVELWGQSTKDYFGTEEDINLNGKFLAIWAEVNDSYSFIRTETASLMLTIKNDTPYPTALMIWGL